MKTTIELPDALFAQARHYAAARNMTMKALIEQALRAVMVEKTDEAPFKLRDGSVNGDGMTPEFENATWEQIRDAIYEGRGA
jgi:predicted DNA-binding ribbon-helix-helix protein